MEIGKPIKPKVFSINGFIWKEIRTEAAINVINVVCFSLRRSIGVNIIDGNDVNITIQYKKIIWY
jgi:hypothetical protein